MAIECPYCGEREKLTVVEEKTYPSGSYYLLRLFGEVVGHLIWTLSRETRFRCGQCDKLFYSHTNLSRFFSGILMLIVALVLMGLGYAAYTVIK